MNHVECTQRQDEYADNGDTALIRAAAAGHTECVRLLAEAGSKLNAFSHSRRAHDVRASC